MNTLQIYPIVCASICSFKGNRNGLILYTKPMQPIDFNIRCVFFVFKTISMTYEMWILLFLAKQSQVYGNCCNIFMGETKCFAFIDVDCAAARARDYFNNNTAVYFSIMFLCLLFLRSKRYFQLKYFNDAN